MNKRDTLSAQDVFYEVQNVPVNSVLLMRTSEQAQNIPRGVLSLTFDPETGLISNSDFDQNLVQYTGDYEETQGFSPTFNAFHERLARDVVNRFDLKGKKIVEIGCGKGEFLNLLCEIGSNEGLGYDPAYHPERNESPAMDRIRFVQDFFSETYAPIDADFVCCKMTLEHIPDVFDFVHMIRRALQDRNRTRVFFQVPDTRRILRDVAFWDIYYEHCSYFCEESLTQLFESAGFAVLQTWTDYDDQYLMIEAKPATIPSVTFKQPGSEFDLLEREVSAFKVHVRERLESWDRIFCNWMEKGTRVALWGGGSKAVAFLTTLRLEDGILGAVDINPHKQSTFLAGTGLPILSPSELKALSPECIVIMNPIYDSEIRAHLNSLNLAPKIFHVDQDPNHLKG